jgi:uncharacterized protein (UPF0548 family)
MAQRAQSHLLSRSVLLVFGILVFVSGQTTPNVPAVLLGSFVIVLTVGMTVLAAFFQLDEHRRQLDGGVLNTLALTYFPVGDTIRGRVKVGGFRSDEHRAQLGAGREAFVEAADAVMRWELKTRAGFRVIRVGEAGAFFSDGPVVRGECAVIRLGLIRETVEVVRVVDRARLRGFAYGTLPEHPLRGEEAFVVEWNADDTVELIIRSFSRPNGITWWLLLPALVIARRIFVRRYLRVLLE